MNSSQRNNNYTFYYNEENQKILAEIHQPDIDYFKFKFLNDL